MKKKLLSVSLVLAMVFNMIVLMPTSVFASNTNQTIVYDGYTVNYAITNSWNNGQYNQVKVTITNTGTEVIENWMLMYDLMGNAMYFSRAKLCQTSEGVNYVKNNGNYGFQGDSVHIGVNQSVDFSYQLVDPTGVPDSFILCQKRVPKTEGVDYTAVMYKDYDYGSTFQGRIVITNLTNKDIESWEMTFALNFSLTQNWTQQLISHGNDRYTVKGVSNVLDIKANQTMTMYFQGTKNSNLDAPSLTVEGMTAVDFCVTPIDSNNNGLPDYYEYYIIGQMRLRGIEVGEVSLFDDYDNDGLNNLLEFQYGTNPFDADTDGDSLSDYDEIFVYFTNPTYWDTDSDGMGDGTEINCGLDPLNPDTNSTSIIDSEKITTQDVRFSSFNKIDFEEAELIPSISITGKGDYSKKIDIEDASYDETFSDISSIVGHPFDFTHDDDLEFTSSTLSFEVDESILEETDIEDLVIAWYDTDNNELVFLDTDIVNANTVSADVEHYSKFLLIDIARYFYDIDVSNRSDIINNGRADIVFAIDTTGSMGSAISNVINNISTFTDELVTQNVDVRLGLVEFKDIYDDGMNTTKSYGWYTDVIKFKSKVSSLYADGGGDYPESAVDGLVTSRAMSFRGGVNKNIILITDETYKNGIKNNPTYTMEDEIKKLKKANISVSVVTNTGFYSSYADLIQETGGILASISVNFSTALESLINKIGQETNDGCWVRLSNGAVVKLDKDPNLGDYSIDTDKDGIPDLMELRSKRLVKVWSPKNGTLEEFETWSFYSNPTKKDTDGDGIDDFIDMKPCIYDICIVENDENEIVFNTGHKWQNIGMSLKDYYIMIYADSLIPEMCSSITDPAWLQAGDANMVNRKYNFKEDELIIISLLNIDGVAYYLDSQSKALRNTIFERLTGNEPRYFKHSGVLWWASWDEVPAGTQGGFWKGTVLSEADFNFSAEIYRSTDIYNVTTTVLTLGIIILATYLFYQAFTVVAYNIEAIVDYCHNLGFKNGIELWLRCGSAAYYPDELFYAVQDGVMLSGEQAIMRDSVIWEENLNLSERTAVVTYSGPSYRNINAALRGLKSFEDNNEAIANTLDNALSRASLASDTILYRGGSQLELGSLYGTYGSNVSSLIGKTYTESAFFSSSMVQSEAEKFVIDLRLIIHAQAGANGVNIMNLSDYADECEILFSQGQAFQILNAELVSGVLNLEVLMLK